MGKLLDDGNTMYKKQRLQETTQRFQYALKNSSSLLSEKRGRQSRKTDSLQFHQTALIEQVFTT